MTPERFRGWLGAWLRRHPLRTPSQASHTAYVEDVMARVRLGAYRAHGWREALWLQVAFAVGVVVACTLVLVLPRRGVTLAQRVDHEWQLLAQLGESDDAEMVSVDDEVQTVDRLMLAEARRQQDDRTWINQTVELLNEVDAGEVGQEDSAIDQWLDELQSLDQADLMSST